MFPVIKIAVMQTEGKDFSKNADWLSIEPRAAVTYINEESSNTEALTERLKSFDIVYVSADVLVLPQQEIYRLEGIKFIVDERKDESVNDVRDWLDERAVEMTEAAKQPDEYNAFLDRIRQGYDEDYPIVYLKEVGRYILSQAEVIGPEYRLLCWLFYRRTLDNPGINVSIVPETLPPAFSLADLPEAFAKGDKREELLEKLQRFISKFKQIYRVNEPVNVVIGGSFSEASKPFPGDIDCIVLVPRAMWDASPYRFAASFASGLKLEETLIDYKLLPEGYELKSFKAYSDLSLMANNARFRDVKMAHNFFKQLDLLVLVI